MYFWGSQSVGSLYSPTHTPMMLMTTDYRLCTGEAFEWKNIYCTQFLWFFLFSIPFHDGDIFPPVQWLALLTLVRPGVHINTDSYLTDIDYTGGYLFRMLLYGKLLR